MPVRQSLTKTQRRSKYRKRAAANNNNPGRCIYQAKYCLLHDQGWLVRCPTPHGHWDQDVYGYDSKFTPCCSSDCDTCYLGWFMADDHRGWAKNASFGPELCLRRAGGGFYTPYFASEVYSVNGAHLKPSRAVVRYFAERNYALTRRAY